jgi:cytochrome c553
MRTGIVMLLAGLVMLTLGANASREVASDAALKLFSEQVRPVLLDQCVKCHGGEKIKGGLDLTTRDGLLHPGDDGPAIIPGNSRDSRLIKLIKHAEEPHMPSKGAKLPEEAIAKIAGWIDAGAPYDKPLIVKGGAARGHATVTDADRKFWAFQPLKRSSPPNVKNENWCRTPIDRFVMEKLEAKGLSANPVADRRKLIRRASFDLVGLPPTPEEVEAFVNDTSPDAYEKLIDRLLASPHYGERWARHWLDLARFGESHGYEQDYDRPTAYHYRDFVIQALNQDMAYDRFVKLQLAGDEMEPDNVQAMMATGFLAAGTHATQITASQAEKERYDELDDLAGTIGTGFLGMTIACARCHDHKFDPIPQQDYYRLISTFTTTVRSEVDLDFHPGKYRVAKVAFDAQHAPLAKALERFEKQELPGRLEGWLKTAPPAVQPMWMTAEVASAKSAGGTTFTKQEDGSYLASGTNPKFDSYAFVVHSHLKSITAIRLEALAHPSFVKGGPGRAGNGNYALSDFSVMVGPLDDKGRTLARKLINPTATFEQKGLPVAAAIDEDKKSAWAIDPEFGKDHAAVFEFEKPIDGEAGVAITVTLRFENNDGHNIGRPRLSLSSSVGPFDPAASAVQQKLVDEMNQVLKTPAEKRSDQQKTALLNWYRTTDSEWTRLNAAVQEHLKQAPKPALTKVLVSTEGLPAVRLHTQGPDFYEKTYFLKRGDLAQKQGEATPSYMQVLMGVSEKEKHWQATPPKGWRTSYRRLSLANWITDVEAGAGHLLARVIVNRLWQHHFGRGIVATPNDFGAQGERPTHPELLDYLATELIRNGWRLKPLHKLIMMSAAYMQNGEYNGVRFAADPDDALLWRMPMRRLEAEAIRDAMLAVSGTLDATMFGPGTLDEAMRRRSIYFFTKRSQLIPMMVLFDAPNSLQGLGNRGSTTIAPQALAMMNNSQVQSYARALAQRLLPKARQSTADAVRYGYMLAFGRQPDETEMGDAMTFIQSQSESYRAAGKENGLELALAGFGQALMSLNEFIYVE